MSTESSDQELRIRSPRTGATEHVVAALTRAIRDDAYGAGERLVESRLTKQFGVSRASVREALRRLEARGLVDIEPHRGAVVRTIGRGEILEIMAVREVLEGLAAALASRNVDREDNRQRLEAMLARIRAARHGASDIDYLRDNLEFHQLIIEVGGSATLDQQINQLQLPVRRSRFFERMTAADWERSLTEHEFIVDAILDGDPILAEQQMRAHVRRTIRLITESAAESD